MLRPLDRPRVLACWRDRKGGLCWIRLPLCQSNADRLRTGCGLTTCQPRADLRVRI
jgi:hypothetical protein